MIPFLFHLLFILHVSYYLFEVCPLLVKDTKRLDQEGSRDGEKLEKKEERVRIIMAHYMRKQSNFYKRKKQKKIEINKNKRLKIYSVIPSYLILLLGDSLVKVMLPHMILLYSKQTIIFSILYFSNRVVQVPLM